MPRAAFASLAVLWLACLAVALGGSTESVSASWPYLVGMVAATAVTATRAIRVRADRLAWALLAAGCGAWAGGDLAWALDPASPGALPDVLYYLDYPLTFAGLGLLMRAHLHPPRPAFWLDGLIVGLAAAAVLAAAVFARIAEGAAGAVTALGYPVLDLATLCLAGLAIGLTGWRPGRAWGLFGAYLVVMVVADSVYGYAEATGAATTGLLATLWPGGAALLAAAAWQDWGTVGAANDGRSTVVVPALGAVAALGVLVHAAFADESRSRVAVVIAAVALAAVLARGWLALRENRALLARSREDALTDGLTGLRNRRALLDDLESLLDAGAVRRLVFCDLDGFKLYNDTFGHLAGDALLARLGERLVAATAGRGTAYRLGGDEFCVLLERGEADDVRGALAERGEGFAIGASVGVVHLPAEAAGAARALQLADERMYADKTSRRPSAQRHARDLLVQILAEREPALSDHTREVAGYALAVARELGVQGEALDEIARAAELHEVGKVAIPDRVLYSTDDLEPSDRRLLQAAPLVGERILSSHPALRPVGLIVRSTHERWAGGGYPDGLAGDAIPLGARIIAVCDAYDAMLAGRPHQAARSPVEAVAELRACAGTQFDPDVVAAFVVVITKVATLAGPRASAAVLG